MPKPLFQQRSSFGSPRPGLLGSVCRKAVLAAACCFIFLPALAQVSISGTTCVSTGVQYRYTISGSWNSSTYMSWCVSGGVISGYSGCASGTPLPSIYITWNSGISSGTIDLSTSSGNASLTVSVAPSLNPGSITSNASQTIAYGATPAAIGCSAASGGYCSPSYAYQWLQSTDDVNWSSVSGGTSQDLSFTGGLTQTTYYERQVTELNTSTSGYSNQAVVTVQAAPLDPGSLPSVSYTNYYQPLVLSVNPSGGSGPYSYQWQSSPDGTNWTAVSPDPNSNTYTTAALSSNTYFRVAVTSGTT